MERRPSQPGQDNSLGSPRSPRTEEIIAVMRCCGDGLNGSIPVRRGKSGRRREVGMDDWGLEQLEPWLSAR